MAKVGQRIRFRIESLNPSRQQYKPYNYTLVPATEVQVEMEVPNENVIEVNQKEGTVVISVDGLATIIGKLCDGLDDMHDQYVMRQRKVGKVA